jgi:hypothetical protein
MRTEGEGAQGRVTPVPHRHFVVAAAGAFASVWLRRLIRRSDKLAGLIPQL